MTTVAVLGSTGSIGTQTLDVVAAQPDRFEIVALGAGSSVEQLAAQARQVRPRVVALADASRAAELAELLPDGVAIEAGPDAMAAVATEADVVVNGVVGFAGLSVTMATLIAGRRLALANKESLIAAGPVVRQVRDTPGAELIPVDSEHCAVHMCLRAGVGTRRLSRVVLTASGGPFRGRDASDLAQVTVEAALAHPTWSMGPKITVDSSTLMNKGLEVIEAHHLFGLSYDRIDVVVHPQSIIHSLIHLADGAALAHLGYPDMRVPISYALHHPDRADVPVRRLDLASLGELTFEQPDPQTFACLRLAREAGEAGGTAPCVLNAANEIAVQAFLDERLSFAGIARVIETTLDSMPVAPVGHFADLFAVDAEARERAREALAELAAV